jgi:hypothetical protein
MLKSLFPILIFCVAQLKVSGTVNSISDSLIVSEIKIDGNFVTNKKLIFRELAFKINTVIDRDEIGYLKTTSINNLTRTSLFNFVELDISEPAYGQLSVNVRLTERWYIWPTLYLNHTDRNFSEWWRTKDLNKLEYGGGLKINNFRGMGETLLLNYRFGNFTKLELEYQRILLDKAEHNSLSFIATWAAKKLLPYVIQSDKQVVLKENYNLIESVNIALRYKYRKGYFNSHNIELGYSDFRIADTILLLNPQFAGLNKQKQRYFNLKYEFIRDNRDSRIYPKTGHLIAASINRKGLKLLPDEYNATEINALFYLYHKVVSRFYLGSGIWYSSTLSDQYAFASETGLGYLQFVRGYEYYAINGDNVFLFKSFLKYELLPMKVINMKVWPIRNLYQFNMIPIEIFTSLFFDAGYVNDKYGLFKNYNNALVDKMMFSTGIGLDFVTYYDKVFRLDYSFNALGESGLFIHWKAAFR